MTLLWIMLPLRFIEYRDTLQFQCRHLTSTQALRHPFALKGER